MTYEPSCCDTEWELLRKILLSLQERVVDQSLVDPPVATDSPYDLYRKILLTLALI